LCLAGARNTPIVLNLPTAALAIAVDVLDVLCEYQAVKSSLEEFAASMQWVRGGEPAQWPRVRSFSRHRLTVRTVVSLLDTRLTANNRQRSDLIRRPLAYSTCETGDSWVRQGATKRADSLRGRCISPRQTCHVVDEIPCAIPLHGSPLAILPTLHQRFPTYILVRGLGRPCRRCSCSGSPAEPTRNDARFGL